MKINFYLVVGKNGTVSTKKNRPDLKWDEISIYTQMELPDALFKKPTLTANITVPNSAASDKVIDSVITDNFKNAIQEAVGTEVKISITSEPSK